MPRLAGRSAGAAAAVVGALLAGLVVSTAAAKGGGWFPHEVFIAVLVGALTTLLVPTFGGPLPADEPRAQGSPPTRQADGPQGPAAAQAGDVDMMSAKTGRATSGVRVRGGEPDERARDLVAPPRATDATDVDPPELDDDRRRVVGDEH